MVDVQSIAERPRAGRRIPRPGSGTGSLASSVITSPSRGAAYNHRQHVAQSSSPEEPQTMFGSALLPQTMLSSGAALPQTMLSSGLVLPHTMLSQSAPPQSLPQTMLSSPALPHTMLSSALTLCPRRCCRRRRCCPRRCCRRAAPDDVVVAAPDDVVAVPAAGAAPDDVVAGVARFVFAVPQTMLSDQALPLGVM